jgi:hypothetical protein
MTSIRIIKGKEGYNVYVNGVIKSSPFIDTEEKAKNYSDSLRREEYARMPKITATELCGFFGFTISPVPQNPDVKDAYGARYVATDNQACFSNRYIDEVSELADCFSGLLPDYIDGYLEEHGFCYVTGEDPLLPDYYEQAQGWIETTATWMKDTDVHKIVCALASAGANITDDVGSAA